MNLSLNAKAVEALQEQMNAFEEKFGYPPGPDDPVWFDPDFDFPVQMAEQKMEDQMITSMDKAGMPPEMIWVYHKAGVIPTVENQAIMAEDAKRDWQEALAEYEANEPDIAALVEQAQIRLAANKYYEEEQLKEASFRDGGHRVWNLISRNRTKH